MRRTDCDSAAIHIIPYDCITKCFSSHKKDKNVLIFLNYSSLYLRRLAISIVQDS